MAATELELPESNPTAKTAGSEAPALLIGRLYEQHYPVIRSLCKLLLRDATEGEDAAQETFLSAYASLIDGTIPRQPAAWLATIARRECWARTAQRRRQPCALDESTTPPSLDSPLDAAIRNTDLAALWQAIDNLPRQQRNAFLMREFAGLPYAEVAAALGATESAIESLLVRARRQLRDGLDATLGAVNAIAAPVLLLHHRLARLLSTRVSPAAAAGIPAAAKLGVTVAGAIALGSAGVATAVLHSHSETPHTGGSTVTHVVARQRPLTHPHQFRSLLGEAPGAARTGARRAARARPSLSALPGSSGAPEAGSAATDPSATNLGTTNPVVTNPNDTNPSPTGPDASETTATDPTDPTPADPTDPTANDSSAIDPTSTDTTATDTAPSATDPTSTDATATTDPNAAAATTSDSTPADLPASDATSTPSIPTDAAPTEMP